MTERRDVFIVPGISREAFTETGVALTSVASDLEYYVHDHRYDLYGAIPCNDKCTVVRMGKVESVTHSDVTDPNSVEVS